MSHENATPRPWAVGAPPEHIITDYRDSGGSMTADNYTGNGWAKTVTVCPSRSWMADGEEFANAALIVEAVNAYDALRAENDRFAEENARLRDALTRIVEPAPGVSHKAPAWACGIAYAALKASQP